MSASKKKHEIKCKNTIEDVKKTKETLKKINKINHKLKDLIQIYLYRHNIDPEDFKNWCIFLTTKLKIFGTRTINITPKCKWLSVYTAVSTTEHRSSDFNFFYNVLYRKNPAFQIQFEELLKDHIAEFNDLNRTNSNYLFNFRTSTTYEQKNPHLGQWMKQFFKNFVNLLALKVLETLQTQEKTEEQQNLLNFCANLLNQTIHKTSRTEYLKKIALKIIASTTQLELKTPLENLLENHQNKAELGLKFEEKSAELLDQMTKLDEKYNLNNIFKKAAQELTGWIQEQVLNMEDRLIQLENCSKHMHYLYDNSSFQKNLQIFTTKLEQLSCSKNFTSYDKIIEEWLINIYIIYAQPKFQEYLQLETTKMMHAFNQNSLETFTEFQNRMIDIILIMVTEQNNKNQNIEIPKRPEDLSFNQQDAKSLPFSIDNILKQQELPKSKRQKL